MAKNKPTIATAISLINSGKKFPVIDLTRSNPGAAATISKLIKPTIDTSTHDNKGNRTIDPGALNGLSQISRELTNKSREFKSMMELFPETELAAQILVSCVISPKDMTKGDVNIVANDELRSAKITAEMLSVLKDYFDQDYKIKPLVPKILRSVLIEQGSDPHIVIPENSIDDLINGSSRITMESIRPFVTSDKKTFRHTGILGNPNIAATDTNKVTGVSFENFFNKEIISDYDPEIKLGNIKSNIFVTDNPQILKLPKILDKNKTMDVKNKLGFNKFGLATEHDNKFNDQQLTSLLYKRKYNQTKPFDKIRPDEELQRLTIGAPLVMRFPSSAVIPVYTPGNEENHIGYFLLLDADGNPLTENSVNTYDQNINASLNSNGEMSTYLMKRAKEGMGGQGCSSLDARQAARVYADIVESDLLARVRNGIHGKNVSIARNEDVYRLMLSRHFANQMTQMLYVPIELVTYFAFRYDSRGIGISLLDGSRHLNVLRSMLLFSGVMARVRNSIGTTKVEMKLDDIDGDPSTTIEMAVHNFMRLRQMNFPTGFSSPGDIYDWVSRAGYEFTFTGHPGLPDMSFNTSEGQRSYTLPDNDLEDELRKRTIMSMGLSPESVDNAFNGDFATTVVANNVLLAKRVTDIQEIMIPQITDHMRKVATNDGNLISKLKSVVEENYEDLVRDVQSDEELRPLAENKNVLIRLVVSEFLSNFKAQLPQPDALTIDNQTTALDAYVEAVDKVVSNYVSSEIFTSEFGGEASSKADEIKNILKSFFIRKWMAENNYMDDVVTNLNDLIGGGDDNENEVFKYADHINKTARLIILMLKDTRGVSNAANKDIEKITGDADLGESEVSSDEPSYDSTGGDSNTDDAGDDFLSDDLDFDAGGGDDETKTQSSKTESSESTTSDEQGNVTKSSSSSSETKES